MKILPQEHTKTLYLIAFYTSTFYIIIGTLTLYYPAEYLLHPRIWSFMSIAAGVSGLLFLLCRSIYVAVFSGALLVGSALLRGLVLFVELGFSNISDLFTRDPISPRIPMFAIGGLTWFITAFLLWLGWPMITARIIKDAEKE